MNRFFLRFANYLDIIGVKCVEDFQIIVTENLVGLINVELAVCYLLAFPRRVQPYINDVPQRARRLSPASRAASRNHCAPSPPVLSLWMTSPDINHDTV